MVNLTRESLICSMFALANSFEKASLVAQEIGERLDNEPITQGYCEGKMQAYLNAAIWLRAEIE